MSRLRHLVPLVALIVALTSPHAVRAVRSPARPPAAVPTVASVFRAVLPAVARATTTIPVYLPSWFPNIHVHVYPSLTASASEWEVRLTDQPTCSALYCVAWLVQGFSGTQVRPHWDRKVDLGAHGVGYLYLNTGSNSLPSMQWTRDGNTYNAVAPIAEASPDQPTLVHIVRSMVRVAPDAALSTRTTHPVRATRATVPPRASVRPIFPSPTLFQYPDLGTYNGGVYALHERGVAYYACAMQPAGFSPSSRVSVDYFVDVYPSPQQAQAKNAYSRQKIEAAVGPSGQMSTTSPFVFEGTALSDPSLSAWGGDTPSIHCNSILGLVYRNVTFSVSLSSQGSEVCNRGSDWPIGLTLRLLQTAVVFAHTHAGAAVPTYPPTSYFHLPLNVAGGPPVPFGPTPQERSDQVAFERCNDFRVRVAVLCQNYRYYVIPNVSNAGHVGPNGGQPRQGSYGVSIYDTTDQARQDNAYERAYGGAPNGPDSQPLALLPIAHPIVSTEWLRGHVINGPTGPEGCDMRGGIRYRNVSISAGLYILFPSRPHGTTPCQASYDWVTRVMATLYARAVTYAR